MTAIVTEAALPPSRIAWCMIASAAEIHGQERKMTCHACRRNDHLRNRLTRAPVPTAFLLAATIGAALAAPPPGADPNSPLGRWYEGLKQPGTGYSCCSLSDCRPVDERIAADGQYEIRLHPTAEYPHVSKHWWRVPAKVVLHGHDNPTGESIACFDARLDDSGAVVPTNFYCFVPDAGT